MLHIPALHFSCRQLVADNFCWLCVYTFKSFISGQSNPAELFSKLVEMGIIKQGEGEGEGETEGSQEGGSGIMQSFPPSEAVSTPIPFAIPNLSFTVATLKR